MGTTWTALLDSYENAIRQQITVIEHYRATQKRAIRTGNFRETQRVNRLLRVLYEEKGEMEESAAMLKQYLAAAAQPATNTVH